MHIALLCPVDCFALLAQASSYTDVLGTLVKLASFGATGVCILAVFWVGILIQKIPADASPDQHKTVRSYMLMTCAIAGIAFASGLANAWFNRATVNQYLTEKTAAENQITEIRSRVSESKKGLETLNSEIQRIQQSSDPMTTPASVTESIGELKERASELAETMNSI